MLTGLNIVTYFVSLHINVCSLRSAAVAFSVNSCHIARLYKRHWSHCGICK